MLREVKIDEEAKTLTLVLDLQEPTPSASGGQMTVSRILSFFSATIRISRPCRGRMSRVSSRETVPTQPLPTGYAGPR